MSFATHTVQKVGQKYLKKQNNPFEVQNYVINHVTKFQITWTGTRNSEKIISRL